METTTGVAPDGSRGSGATAATGPAGPEGSGETALAGVGAVLRLDLIVLRRRGPLLLLPLALFIAMDVLAGRLQTTVMAGVALGLCAQYAQGAVESAHHMERLYGALPLRRSELVGARWVEGVALALLSGLVCVLVAALTGDWGGLMAGMVVICLSAALGLPLFLCLAPAPPQAHWEPECRRTRRQRAEWLRPAQQTQRTRTWERTRAWSISSLLLASSSAGPQWSWRP